jgi:hypothetical protein
LTTSESCPEIFFMNFTNGHWNVIFKLIFSNFSKKFIFFQPFAVFRSTLAWVAFQRTQIQNQRKSSMQSTPFSGRLPKLSCAYPSGDFTKRKRSKTTSVHWTVSESKLTAMKANLRYKLSTYLFNRLCMKHIEIAMSKLNLEQEVNSEHISIVEQILRETRNPKIAAVLALDLMLVGVDTVSGCTNFFRYKYRLVSIRKKNTNKKSINQFFE